MDQILLSRRMMLSLGTGVLLTNRLTGVAQAPEYSLLLRNGHLIDPRNQISGPRDIAIQSGRIAAVAPHIEPARARLTVDATGLYVTPGLIDPHVHIYAGTGERNSYAGDRSVYPDGFTFRAGVTTVADAGSSGWRNFEDFKTRVVDRARTRVFAFLNIVGAGMRGLNFEQNLEDMQAKPTAEMAQRHQRVVVGIKTAHYQGPEFIPVERSVEAGTTANIPIMVDYGRDFPQRRLEELLASKLRAGDIYTHVYSGLRREMMADGHPNPGLAIGRRRGILFDVGHGGGSFAWRVADGIVKSGFLPDTISTDLHTGSMNAGMHDMLNVMSKFLALGLSLDDVIVRSTWNCARALKQEQLGHLSVGAVADVAVLRLERGDFGFVDSFGARQGGNHRLACEMTLREGAVVYDLNGLSRPDWQSVPENKKSKNT